MAEDPLSRVAAWLTPASADVTDKPPPTSPQEDPVIALIAEAKRLDALWTAVTTRGDEIFSTLPEDIRKGQVQVSFSGPSAALLDGGFASEAALHRLVGKGRRLATVFCRVEVERGRIGAEDLAAEEAEFDREIGEAEDLARRAGEVGDQILSTKPVTIAGAIAMLEWSGADEDGSLIDTVLAGLRDMQPEASRSSFVSDMNQRDSTLLAAEQRLAELQLAEDETYRSYREAGQPITIENEQELICDVFDDEIFAAQRIIDETPPQSLVGAAVKLRKLAAKQEDGLEGPLSYASVRQVLAIVEREIASRRVTLAGHFGDETGNDVEPAVIGFGEPEEGGAA